MKARYVSLIAVLMAFGLGLGWWLRGWLPAPEGTEGPTAVAHDPATGPCPGGAEPLYWRAPMDPAYVRNAPGKSPMGMDLVPECPSAGSSPAEGIIQIDPSTVQNIGVRTAIVEERDLTRKIRAVGRVAYDERLVAHSHTKVQGWVEKLFVDYVGQTVKRGQPLLEIYSPELVATQEELLLAARYRTLTEESPFDDVSRGGRALYEATRRRMELWDIPDRDVERLLETGKINKTLTLYAPSSGVVTKLGVRVGMEVKPNEMLYTIADLSKVWVVADVYEFELPWVELGQRAALELSYLPEARFSGPITYISPFLDPKTRTAQVRIELPNPDGDLKPEMFGNVTIESAPRKRATAVPSEAVIRSGRRNLAIVALGAGRFEPREILIGLDSGDGWLEVTHGLEPGEVVVASSQFLIDSESNLEEAVRKLLASSAEDTAHPAHGDED